MQFTQSLKYKKPAAAVIKMFGDRTYFERKFQMLEAHSFAVKAHEASGDTFMIRMKLTLPMSAPVPGFAKKVVGETTTLVETDEWDLAQCTGRITVEVQGAPVKASGQMRLEDSGDGSTNTITWDVSCQVPLIGKKIEKLIADDIKAKAAEDERVSNIILDDYDAWSNAVSERRE